MDFKSLGIKYHDDCIIRALADVGEEFKRTFKLNDEQSELMTKIIAKKWLSYLMN